MVQLAQQKRFWLEQQLERPQGTRDVNLKMLAKINKTTPNPTTK